VSGWGSDGGRGMSAQLLNELLDQQLYSRRKSQQWRVRHAIGVLDSTHVELYGRRLVNFASNDYLGLTHHPRVLEAAGQAAVRCGMGSGASPLITGYSLEQQAGEAAIARWKQAEAAVLLASGYQTAQAVVQTLAAAVKRHGPGGRFLLDKLCHASLIDAVRGSGVGFRVFPHNHLGKLARLLAAAPEGQLQIVITESIFSMDGDAADLAGLAEVKAKHPFVLVLDEAHGSGVYGPAGAGYAAECGLGSVVDIAIVTLSKALGLAGGAVCGSGRFCDAVVNCGRAYIYSTSPPAMLAAAAVAAIGVLRDEPQRQQRVRGIARRVRTALLDKGIAMCPGDSPIIPVILKSEHRAMEAAERLRDQGLLVIAIRPPTVAANTSRLRITLSSDHSDDEVEALISAVSPLRFG